jgi:type 1 fimbriae regulatory protein FimB
MARPKGTEKVGLKYLNEAQLDRFFKAIDKSGSHRDRFLFRLILFLGLRISEASLLKLEDINFDSYQIAVKGLKNGRSRVYDLTGRLWHKLSMWLKYRKAEKNPYLFPSDRYFDEPVTAQSLKNLFKEYAEKAGLNGDFSIHSLRHSCGITLARKGESAISIMLWLRHRSIQSAQVYFEQLQDEEMNDRAKESFSAFL